VAGSTRHIPAVLLSAAAMTPVPASARAVEPNNAFQIMIADPVIRV
jgi:hypothetical protein